MTLQEVIEACKALDPEERLEAARQLLLSVDQDGDDQAGVDAAWDEVVDRRVREILTGTAKLVDGREAHARLRAELARSASDARPA
ncbi:MAG: addiction module protein [Microbacteriaceae bacterium]|nr:addiction module protein [Microbacteriaceae bacterium]